MVHQSSIAIIYVNCTLNNTHILVSTIEGRTLISCSTGVVGFRGNKRSTTYASLIIAKYTAIKSYKKGIREIYVQLKGFGSGRKYCIKGFLAGKIHILEIKDVTFLPHNGCKASKQRRV
jgi:small subunit ribosomal protein S11